MKKKIELIMAVCFIAAAFLLANRGTIFVQSDEAKEKKTCIVIDAGHGSGNLRKVTKGK